MIPQGTNVLPSDTEGTYNLHWQSDILPYKNDFDVYVWQPHLQKTPSAYHKSLTIIVPPKDSTHQTTSSSTDFARRLLVIADPPCLMPRFLDTEDALVRSGSQTQHAWDADHEKFRVIALFFKWMVDDSSKLVDDMLLKATDMTYRGRRMPTRSKIQYLVHLDDCRRLAISDLKQANVVFGKARSSVEANTFCRKEKADKEIALKVFEGFQDDLEFIVGKLEALEKPIATARAEVIEQMSLAQGQRAFILTIAAAFFVPLSFIASIFGMNVPEPLFPSKKTTATTTSSFQARLRQPLPIPHRQGHHNTTGPCLSTSRYLYR